MDANTELAEFANHVLAEIRPNRLLLIGSTAVALAPRYQAAEPQAEVVTIDRFSAGELDDTGQVDLAIVIDALEDLPHATAGFLLGQLRDLLARRILVTLRTDSATEWTHRDMIGHGFVRMSDRFGPVQMYEFDISTYKTTPDWLNSKNWANPNLFDKFRW